MTTRWDRWGAAVAMLVMLAPAARAAGAKRSWTADGITYELTATDFVARRGSEKLFSAQALVDKDVDGTRIQAESDAEELAKEPDQEPMGMTEWDASASLKPLSVVGTWVSYEWASGGYTGGAHPNAFTIYTARDLSRPVEKEGDGHSLLDLFPEDQVVAALARDPFLKKHMKAGSRITTFAQLAEAVDGDCDFSFNDGALASFAFHHLEGNKVAVRIGLPYGCEAARGNLTQLGILLPIPAKLADALARADRGEQGFLMKDVKKLGISAYEASWQGDLKEMARKHSRKKGR